MKEVLVKGNASHLSPLFPKMNTKKEFQGYWSSPEKMANEIATWKKSDAWHVSGWEVGNENFYGTRTLEEALDIARGGWKEGVEKVQKFHSRIMAQNPIQKKPIQYGIEGAIPSVPRAVAGNPMSMRKPSDTNARRRPVITLVSDLCASCQHDSEEYINRAAVIAAIIDQMEAAGYSVEVLGIAYSEGGRWYDDAETSFMSRVHVMVKESHQPIDIARVAFGLGHPGMFRRLMFCVEGYYHFNKTLGEGLGRVHKIKIGSDFQKELAEKDVYVLPSLSGNDFFKTEEKALTEGVQYILKALRKQKCPCLSYRGLGKDDIKEKSDGED